MPTGRRHPWLHGPGLASRPPASWRLAWPARTNHTPSLASRQLRAQGGPHELRGSSVGAPQDALWTLHGLPATAPSKIRDSVQNPRPLLGGNYTQAEAVDAGRVGRKGAPFAHVHSVSVVSGHRMQPVSADRQKLWSSSCRPAIYQRLAFWPRQHRPAFAAWPSAPSALPAPATRVHAISSRTQRLRCSAGIRRNTGAEVHASGERAGTWFEGL